MRAASCAPDRAVPPLTSNACRERRHGVRISPGVLADTLGPPSAVRAAVWPAIIYYYIPSDIGRHQPRTHVLIWSPNAVAASDLPPPVVHETCTVRHVQPASAAQHHVSRGAKRIKDFQPSRPGNPALAAK
jgi:hypothetical protein